MPSHSRKSERPSLVSSLAHLDRKKVIIGGVIALVIVGVIVAIAATGGGGPKKSAAPPVTVPTVANNNCPLTDLPAPGGSVPQREPIAVKIGNEPDGARPQSGLNEADIVYDTPAEGGIMRYVAIFQCQNVSSIGPVRSVRWVDWHVISVFKHAALAFVGGVNPNQATVAAKTWIDDANEFLHYGAYHDDPARTAPDATYTSTSAIYGLFSAHPAPQPIFAYGASLPSSAKPASKLAINFSAGTDVQWTWNAATNQWEHAYSGSPDIDSLTGKQVSTTNIVVEVVSWKYGPYVESPGGSGDIESKVIGSGKGYVLRDGKEIPVTWTRKTAQSDTVFKDASGQAVTLAPGRTWVEIVLDTTYNQQGAFSITP